MNNIYLWAQNNFEITLLCFQFSFCSFVNLATKTIFFKAVSFQHRCIMVVFVIVTCFCLSIHLGALHSQGSKSQCPKPELCRTQPGVLVQKCCAFCQRNISHQN